MSFLNRWLVADNLEVTSCPQSPLPLALQITAKTCALFCPLSALEILNIDANWVQNNKLSLNCWKITVNWEKQVRKLINLEGKRVVIKQIEDSERWAKLKRSRFS